MKELGLVVVTSGNGTEKISAQSLVVASMSRQMIETRKTLAIASDEWSIIVPDCASVADTWEKTSKSTNAIDTNVKIRLNPIMFFMDQSSPKSITRERPFSIDFPMSLIERLTTR